jgi:hypothetical protein
VGEATAGGGRLRHTPPTGNFAKSPLAREGAPSGDIANYRGGEGAVCFLPARWLAKPSRVSTCEAPESGLADGHRPAIAKFITPRAEDTLGRMAKARALPSRWGSPRVGSNPTGVVAACPWLLVHTNCRNAARRIVGFAAMALRSTGTSSGIFRAADVTLCFLLGPQSAATPNLRGGHLAVASPFANYRPKVWPWQIFRDRGRPRADLKRDRWIRSPEVRHEAKYPFAAPPAASCPNRRRSGRVGRAAARAVRCDAMSRHRAWVV